MRIIHVKDVCILDKLQTRVIFGKTENNTLFSASLFISGKTVKDKQIVQELCKRHYFAVLVSYKKIYISKM